ncbi:hypothetical protein [Globicatella sanguinis]
MSGLELRLKEIGPQLGKFNQLIVIKLKAQWLSGLKRRLSTCLRPTQLCGGEQTKRKLFNFLLLVHSQLCGGRQINFFKWESYFYKYGYDFLLYFFHQDYCERY